MSDDIDRIKSFLSWIFWPRKQTAELLKLSVVLVVLDNLLPLFGVLLFGWTVFPVLVFYCVESFLLLSFKSLELAKIEQKIYKWRLGAWYVIASFIFHSLITATSILIIVNTAPSRADHAIEYIHDYYFIISVIILGLSIAITEIRDLREIKKYKIKLDVLQLQRMYLFLVIKMGLLIGITAAIAYTGAFSSALIIVICVKAFLDLRSFVRNQITFGVDEVVEIKTIE